jgi:hypothetical protein
LIGVGLVTPGEEFSCSNELADRLIEQGRATLVDDQGRTSDAAPDVDTAPSNADIQAGLPSTTPTKKSKAEAAADVATDAAALAAAENEGLAAPTTGAVVTGTRSQATLDAVVAADSAALSTAEAELASAERA